MKGTQLLFTSTGTAAAVGETKNISGFKCGTLRISGLTGETIAVTSRVGATTGAGPCSYTVADVAAAPTALGNGTFFFRNLSVDSLIFTKSAATENATVTFLAS